MAQGLFKPDISQRENSDVSYGTQRHKDSLAGLIMLEKALWQSTRNVRQ
jgi:hypothetical protein